MRVRRNPVVHLNERAEVRPEMDVVLEKAGVGVRAPQEQPPGVAMALEAG